jgi:uncharacterized membrane protein YfcA
MLFLWRIILLVAIWLFFESVISWAAFCRHQNEYSSVDQTAESYECVFRGPIASIARWFAGWWVHAFDKADAYIALFTAVLAISTPALWWSTRKLWNVTRIEAEHIPRVERAYVSGGATGVVDWPQHFAVPSIIMEKPPHSLVLFGQTLSQKTSCQILPFTIRRNLAGSAVKC